MNWDKCDFDGHDCCGHYRAFVTDMTGLISTIERQFDSLMNEIETNPGLPAKGFRGSFFPVLRGDMRVDIREHDDEIIVVADIPGGEKENISVEIVDQRTLQISCQRITEQEKDAEGYYMRERMFGSTRRIVNLPADVKDSDCSGSFKNGVLEIRLKKAPEEKGKHIPIE